MPKSNILKILRLFSLEEMLKLVQGVRIQHVSLKKAAGEELISLDPVPEKPKKEPKKNPTEATILPFPTSKTPAPPVEEIEPLPETVSNAAQFYATEDILWQRELAKDSFSPLHKLEAIKGYKKAIDVYIVKNCEGENKQKIRFASTNGVLVNKKQD